MKDSDLADILLRGLYATKSVTKLDDLVVIAAGHGNENRAQIDRVGDDLADSDLITDIHEDSDGYMARLTGKAWRAVEEVGAGGSVMAYLQRPQATPGVSISGGTFSNTNIAANSPHATQSVTAPNDMREAMERMTETLKADKSLSEADREKALQDVESLQLEICKPRPNLGVIGYLVATISLIPSVVESARAILRAVQGMMP